MQSSHVHPMSCMRQAALQRACSCLHHEACPCHSSPTVLVCLQSFRQRMYNAYMFVEMAAYDFVHMRPLTQALT